MELKGEIAFTILLDLDSTFTRAAIDHYFKLNCKHIFSFYYFPAIECSDSPPLQINKCGSIGCDKNLPTVLSPKLDIMG